MQKRKSECPKCKKHVNPYDTVCFHCGAVLVVKTGMLKKKDLKKFKEI